MERPIPGLPAATSLREARRRIACGDLVATGSLSPMILASWQRCRARGLDLHGTASGVPHASTAQLARLLEERRQLVSHARPVLEYLGEQVRGTGSLIFLADPSGTLLCSLGDDSFADRAARVALRPGANWQEQWRGTNAIGTAIACVQPVVVQGQEHYLERNGFLACAATPIIGSRGELLGVIDITARRGQLHPHTLGLVRSAARQVEHRLFESQHANDILLRLHTAPEGLGTLTEGLLALSEDGTLIGIDSAAAVLLGLPGSALGGVRVEDALGVHVQALVDATRAHHLSFHPPGRPDGATVHGVVCRNQVAPALAVRHDKPPAPRAVAMDALAALDLGDAALQTLIARARKVLDKPIPLLILGDSGVGKEVFARACHASSRRVQGPFVAVNCAALPDHLIESELFGYRSGAFTGASRHGGVGHVREAHGGTLFLDEIGDMPLQLQTRLLRVLQDRQVIPLGGGSPVPVDFQLICATNRVLKTEVLAGRFREDLYYRINGLALHLPPLRERTDLPSLVRFMLETMSPDRRLELSPAVLRLFQRCSWPGNLRQMASTLQTAIALLEPYEAVIDVAHLSDELVMERPSGPGSRPLHESADLRANEERCLRQALEASGGNLSDAARRLGVSRSTLYRKLQAGGAGLKAAFE